MSCSAPKARAGASSCGTASGKSSPQPQSTKKCVEICSEQSLLPSPPRAEICLEKSLLPSPPRAEICLEKSLLPSPPRAEICLEKSLLPSSSPTWQKTPSPTYHTVQAAQEGTPEAVSKALKILLTDLPAFPIRGRQKGNPKFPTNLHTMTGPPGPGNWDFAQPVDENLLNHAHLYEPWPFNCAPSGSVDDETTSTISVPQLASPGQPMSFLGTVPLKSVENYQGYSPNPNGFLKSVPLKSAKKNQGCSPNPKEPLKTVTLKSAKNSRGYSPNPNDQLKIVSSGYFAQAGDDEASSTVCAPQLTDTDQQMNLPAMIAPPRDWNYKASEASTGCYYDYESSFGGAFRDSGAASPTSDSERSQRAIHYASSNITSTGELATLPMLIGDIGSESQCDEPMKVSLSRFLRQPPPKVHEDLSKTLEPLVPGLQ
eukprot:TRINITY_DN10997_c0_g1_i1.p1 TRINITY_DN10997_c0_g1~~TRINITY_DN10997_c0_g1_i1.p1  ORF type:complete len:428 (+),score=63.14 TRINITY_DN10997_c0_g1_i1:52-1335(+)